ncbi:MAG TPA: cytochrome c oxidase subunit II [Candidatus Kapabacteria bacterium]|nr:cytochrome c oxidase subunit II [Candidatus Kapabacteria bacterium]
MEKFLGMPVDASAQAPAFDQMMSILHWLMFVMFIGWTGYMIYLVWRFRSSKHPKAGYAGSKTKFAIYLALFIAVIEIGIDMGYSVPIWDKRADIPPEKDAIVVRVVAEQFAWNVHYPGPDGVFGRTSPDLITADNPLGLDRTDPYAKDDITTLNQLNLPADKPVIVHLTSKDVIHSFNIPVMRVKQDAIPGLTIPVWFTPTLPGNYEIACAQLCGMGHYHMRGYINIQTPEDFQSWMNDQEKALAPAPADTMHAAVSDTTATSAK